MFKGLGIGSGRKSGSPISRGSGRDNTRGTSKKETSKSQPPESRKGKGKAVESIKSVKRAGSDLSQPPHQTQSKNSPGQQGGIREQLIFFCCLCLKKKTLPVPKWNPIIRTFEFKGRVITQTGVCQACSHMMESCGGQCVVQKASDPITPWVLGLAARSTRIATTLPWGEHSGWDYDHFRHLEYRCYPGYTCCACHTANPLQYLEEGPKWMKCLQKDCFHRICRTCEKLPALTSPPPPQSQAPTILPSGSPTRTVVTGSSKSRTGSRGKSRHAFSPLQSNAGPSAPRPLPPSAGTPATSYQPKALSPSPRPKSHGKYSSPPGRSVASPRPQLRGKPTSPPASTRRVTPWLCCLCLEKGHEDCRQPNIKPICGHVFNKGTGREYVCNHLGEHCTTCQ